MSSETVDKTRRPDGNQALITAFCQAVSGIRFGSVEIVIHEGQIVQIERREKVRWDRNRSSID